MSVILWIRCLFTGGHEQVPVQIVPTKFEAYTDPDQYTRNTVVLYQLQIESPLTYCCKCGRLRYGP